MRCSPTACAAISALWATMSHAQDCSIPFTAPLFDARVESGLWYGNATRFDGGTDSLRMNLYKPVGDGQTERPLVVLIHGGGFYEGHRNDFNTLCEGLASYGWAAATISYRLGFYGNWLAGPPYAQDAAEVERAIHRAMQDAKGAIRFLKGRSAQDSTSTTSVFLLGGSAGAITALHVAYLDRPEERMPSTMAIAPVQHVFNFYPRPDLGSIDGELNLNGHDASVLGVVNIFGALKDTALVESDADPALFSYHQSGDPVVGCGVQRPYWGVGLGIADTYPWLHGSCAIDPRMLHLGFTAERYRFQLHAGNEHAVHDPAGFMAEATQWMRDLMCSGATGIMQPQALEPRVAPNPARDAATVITPNGTTASFSLMDGQGRIVASGSLLGERDELDLRGLSPGAYVIRIVSPMGISAVRLLKE